MTHYIDTSFLCKFYLIETASGNFLKWLKSIGEPIGINSLQELELLNAIHGRVFRREISFADAD